MNAPRNMTSTLAAAAMLGAGSSLGYANEPENAPDASMVLRNTGADGPRFPWALMRPGKSQMSSPRLSQKTTRKNRRRAAGMGYKKAHA